MSLQLTHNTLYENKYQAMCSMSQNNTHQASFMNYSGSSTLTKNIIIDHFDKMQIYNCRIISKDKWLWECKAFLGKFHKTSEQL